MILWSHTCVRAPALHTCVHLDGSATRTKMATETDNLLKRLRLFFIFVCITPHSEPQGFANHGVHHYAPTTVVIEEIHIIIWSCALIQQINCMLVIPLANNECFITQPILLYYPVSKGNLFLYILIDDVHSWYLCILNNNIYIYIYIYIYSNKYHV